MPAVPSVVALAMCMLLRLQRDGHHGGVRAQRAAAHLRRERRQSSHRSSAELNDHGRMSQRVPRGREVGTRRAKRRPSVGVRVWMMCVMMVVV